MKQNLFKSVGIVTVGSLCVTGVDAVTPEKMNVVFILADDLGWSDVSIYGTTKLYQTPNLERLAARGMIFNNAYSASPLSSPTRASILTGQTPARHGITAPHCHLKQELLSPRVMEKAPAGNKAIQCVSATRLDTKLPTLGKLVRDNGYATAHFGKWHLGPEPYSPLEHGFDLDIPHWPGPGPAGSYIAPWKFPKFTPLTPGEHIEDRMANEAVNWLRNRPKDKPFFMNYWQFSVHAPFDAKKSLIDKYRPLIDMNSDQKSPTYAAMVESMDDAIGTLLDEIDRQGIADQTIIIFISDNGGNMYTGINETDKNGNDYLICPTSNSPLRGGKATMFEGGIRVPCVVVWPGVTKPGSRSDARIQTTDFYPTLLNALNIPMPKKHVVDGYDIKPALSGAKFERQPMYTYFPHSPGVPDWLPPSVSVHVGDWKLIRMFYQGEDGEHAYLLYNLKDDLSEQNDLSKENPKKVKELDALIEKYLSSTKAVIPKINPAFDKSKYDPAAIGVQKGGLKVPNAAKNKK